MTVDDIQPMPSHKVLHTFRPTDGEQPQAGLIRVNGEFYGTAFAGEYGSCRGSGGCGSVYKISKNGRFTVLHRFAYYYGHLDGANPSSELIDVNGTLYGTTYNGGKFGDGTVYSISTSGSEQLLYSFRGGSDGANPSAALINVNGTLYGTTQNGGVTGLCKYTSSRGCGAVYSITTAGREKVLHRFGGGSDGMWPEAPLIDVNGTLYGTTVYGGGYGCYKSVGCGVVFSVNLKGSEKVLYTFQGGSDGISPASPLIDVQGTLYGTTEYGGGSGCRNGCGSFYRISLSGQEKVLHRFRSGPGGSAPRAGLIEVNSKLYGTTTAGGNLSESGTIYSMSTAGVETVLYKFKGGSDGSCPDAPLIYANRRFFGTSAYGGISGGPDGLGTVFALTP
jgi:uncharacterized repeat protein (TIGR03803 family)